MSATTTPSPALPRSLLRSLMRQAAEGFSPEADAARRVQLSDLWIQTKDQRFIPLAPNAVQEALLDGVAPKWRDGDYTLTGIRKIILKARQFGYSKIILALLFLATANNSDVNTVVRNSSARMIVL